MTTSEMGPALWSRPDNRGWGRRAPQRTSYCNAHECLTRTVRDLACVQEAEYAQAVERGYHPGPLFLEADNSGSAMEALIDAVTRGVGRAAVAVPHRGHLIPIGGAWEWQAFLQDLTDHPLVFARPTHDQRSGHAGSLAPVPVPLSNLRP
jgi:hypothetical protein